MRVLVVDDDESILGFIRNILTDEGYQALEAIDGAEALDLASLSLRSRLYGSRVARS